MQPVLMQPLLMQPVLMQPLLMQPLLMQLLLIQPALLNCTPSTSPTSRTKGSPGAHAHVLSGAARALSLVEPRLPCLPCLPCAPQW